MRQITWDTLWSKVINLIILIWYGVVWCFVSGPMLSMLVLSFNLLIHVHV